MIRDFTLKLRGYAHRIRGNSKVMRQLYAITLVSALLIASVVFRTGLESGKYIVDEDGNVVGVERKSLERVEEYPLIVRIEDSNGNIEKEVVLSGDSFKESPSEQSEGDEEERRNIRQQKELELQQILNELEAKNEKKLMLPSALSDGSVLTWNKVAKSNNDVRIIVGGYFILMILVLYQQRTPINKERERNRKEILNGLPRFVNQLVMMMHAGVILSDAFERICGGYRLMPENRRTGFEAALIQIADQNADHRISTAMLLGNLADQYGVKELLRITTILIENERRGSDVVESLRRESGFLWEERKIVASERGKLIDTEMALPLAMLLILLIIVVMSPAILAMM